MALQVTDSVLQVAEVGREEARGVCYEVVPNGITYDQHMCLLCTFLLFIFLAGVFLYLLLLLLLLLLFLPHFCQKCFQRVGYFYLQWYKGLIIPVTKSLSFLHVSEWVWLCGHVTLHVSEWVRSCDLTCLSGCGCEVM